MPSGKSMIVVGAMSGTSADGVDVALTEVTIESAAISGARLVAHRHEPYPNALREQIFAARGDVKVGLKELAGLARSISLAYAKAACAVIEEAAVERSTIAAIAAHGQTLFHDPPSTIQWLDPALLAAETGCAVVSDFRRADCAAGGQGAPLVPFADRVLFQDAKRSRVLLNIGGIANLTFVPRKQSGGDLIAFDTGPGNCISDWLMRTRQPAGKAFDAGGAIAAKGVLLAEIIDAVTADAYFDRVPPKSTDGPAMIQLFERARDSLAQAARIEDLLHTACALTAQTIGSAIQRFLPAMPDELIVSGGGVENQTMMWLLREALPGIPIRRTDDFGVPAEAKEAMAFAILGAATLAGIGSNVPSATGAKYRVILGSITPRQECR